MLPDLRTSVLVAGLSALACSTTKQGTGSRLCGGSDGCVAAQITTYADWYDGGAGQADGRGTFYVALLDTCPLTNVGGQFSYLSEFVTAEVDFPSRGTVDFEIGVSFSDPEFPLKEGDSGFINGFLDDDQSSAGSTNPVPENEDTVSNCIEVTLKKGRVILTSSLVPCLYFDLTSGYVYDQSPVVACPGLGFDAGPDAPADSSGDGGG